eukprot:TRINITY_DN12577_c0_g1_i2.p1 TRINITY_DN12577_c0_g1~~TRINITY_DN12577_c0_g1_i2.p1  ORF type:complete len:146 (+),score=15.14 TRINITY_DN12577_c0_g1_i2:90-527(+)
MDRPDRLNGFFLIVMIFSSTFAAVSCVIFGLSAVSLSAIFFGVVSVFAYYACIHNHPSLAIHLTLFSGYIFQLFFTINADHTPFRILFICIPVVTSVFTLPDSFLPTAFWYIVASATDYYLFLHYDTTRDISYLNETTDVRLKTQ